jgi:hypothetical protein
VQDEDLPFEVSYPELIAWISIQEELSASEFDRFARQPVREIQNLYEELRQHIHQVRELDLPPHSLPGTEAALQAVLETFDPSAGLLAGPDPTETDAFYTHAWTVGQRCDSCLAEYSHLLLPVCPDLVLALHTTRDGIRREVGTIAPAVTEYRLLTGRMKKIRKIHGGHPEIDAETRNAMAKETLATANIHTYETHLAAFQSSLAMLMADPQEFAARKYLELVSMKKERDTLEATYKKLAALLHDLTRRALVVVQNNGDSGAATVIEPLLVLFEKDGVPDGDLLFSALINGYPVLLEMIDTGDLVIRDETEQYLFMDAGSFNNGMRNLCKDYQATGHRYDRALAAWKDSDILAKEAELGREIRELEALIRSEVATRDDARSFVDTTSVHRQTMARMIEDCLLEMTGRTSRLRLNWPPADTGMAQG